MRKKSKSGFGISEKSSWKKICFLLLWTAAFLTACTTVDGEVKGKEEVLSYVGEVCPSEKFRLLSTEKIAEKPDNVEYIFETEGRKLLFKANSYLQNIQIDASRTNFYSKKISCSYVEEVHNIYRERIGDCIHEADSYDSTSGELQIFAFSDIKNVSEVLEQAFQIYAEELAYNDKKFLKEHPVGSVRLVWYPSRQAAAKRADGHQLALVEIDGLRTQSEIYRELADDYAQECVDGNIEDRGDVPEKYLATKHKSMLDKIYVNGKKMKYDLQQSPYSSYPLTNEDYKYSWYSEEENSYMLVCDTGYISDSSSAPLIIAEYVRALGGGYDMDPEKRIIWWKIGEDEWRLQSEKSQDGGISGLSVKKNGKELDISYVTVQEDYNVRAAFCAGLKVEDFVKLFDLEYEVDEKENALYLTGKK